VAEAQDVVVGGVRPGRWRAFAFSPGCLPFRGEPFDVPADGRPALADVVLRRATASVLVEVRDARGPVAGARVSSYEWVSWLLDGNRTSAVTDDGGRARLTGLLGTGTPLRVEVAAEGYLPRVVEAGGDARDGSLPLVARLVRPAVVHGVYRDGHTKAPIPHARVDLLRGDGSSRMKDDYAGIGTTDAEGRYRFEALPPGRYTIAPAGGRAAAVTLEEGATEEVALTDGKW
jgi:hypothetical protein